MVYTNLSTYEQQYILQGVENDCRGDGRSRLDYRHFTVETGVLSNTNGSSRLRLAGTDILVGIKAEIGEPNPITPNEGNVFFSVECSTSASPEYQGRGGDVLSATLTRCFERMVDHKDAINKNYLCIIPQKQCWNIFIDAMIMVNGGNVNDAMALAIRAALIDTDLPKIEVVEEDGELEIELSDNPDDNVKLNIENWPVMVTLNKIGNNFIVDASIEEEGCMMGRVMCGVNKIGNITCMQKSGFGGIDPHSLPEILQYAQSFGQTMITNLDKVVNLQKQKEECGKYKKLGFLGTAH